MYQKFIEDKKNCIVNDTANRMKLIMMLPLYEFHKLGLIDHITKKEKNLKRLENVLKSFLKRSTKIGYDINQSNLTEIYAESNKKLISYQETIDKVIYDITNLLSK